MNSARHGEKVTDLRTAATSMYGTVNRVVEAVGQDIEQFLRATSATTYHVNVDQHGLRRTTVSSQPGLLHATPLSPHLAS